MADSNEKSILEIVKKYFNQGNENGLIMADTVMDACNFTQENKNSIEKHGLKIIPDFVDSMAFNGFTDEQFISNLFNLEQKALDQLPINFYGEIVQSKAFTHFSKDRQNEILGRIFITLGIDSPEQFAQFAQFDADNIAYNHKSYKTIFATFFALNKKDDQQELECNQFINQIVDQKLQEVLDNAPAITYQLQHKPNETIQDLTQLSAKHKGNLEETTEDVLSNFNDTKYLDKETIKSLGLGKNFEQYSSTTAKAVLAQKKLGAYANAAEAKGLIKAEDVEKISVVDTAQNEQPVNQYVNACKNVIASFTKPQNLARLGFRQVAISGISHLVGGAVPGIGASVGLAIKLAQCGKKIFKEKRKASEVFKEATPDLVRNTVTLGVSFIPLVAIAAGPIGTVASIAMKGVQSAHQEGLKIGHGFMKRVGAEFKKAGNLVNLGMSIAGAGLGFGARKFLTETELGGQIQDNINLAKAGVAGLFAKHESDLGSEIDVQLPSDVNEISSETIDEMTFGSELNGTPNAMAGDPRFMVPETPNAMEGDPRFIAPETTNAMAGDPRFVGNETTEAITDNVVTENAIIEDSITENAITEEAVTTSVEEQDLQQLDEQLSYVEQYLRSHPGATVDKNGWVQNADGSYAHNENGQLFGIEERVFRSLTSDETLDQYGNIVDKAPVIEENIINEDVTEIVDEEIISVPDISDSRHDNLVNETVHEDVDSIPYQDLPVRSPEELAQLDAQYHHELDNAHKFNMLPSEEQKALIDLQAQMAAAKNHQDELSYNRLKDLFEKRFDALTEQEQALRDLSEQANISGTPENIERDSLQNYIAHMQNGSPEKEAAIRDFTARYGEDMGTNPATGVRQYVRSDGNYKMGVPDAPQKNFAELGYIRQENGSWLHQAGNTSQVVIDTNGNGILDAGDTYVQTIDTGISQEVSTGTFAGTVKETVDTRNFEYAMKEATERYENMLNQGHEL